MNTEAVQIFSAVLAVVVLATGVLTLACLVLESRMTWAASWVRAMDDIALWAISAVTTGTMLGSLYFSEVASLAPCELCWYQRIGVYPIAIMSWVALVRRDRKLGPYWIALSLAGIAVSIYHYLLEWFPEMKSSVCSVDVPCTTVWFREFGFVTLAFMAGCAFIFVIAMSLVMVKNPAGAEE
jgi:disulfide bond formation protein DsbB